MHPAATVVLAILAAAGTSFAVLQLGQPAPPPAAPESDTSALQREIQALRQELDELRRAPERAPAAVVDAANRTIAPLVEPEQVAAAVERYLAQRAEAGGAVADAEGAGKPVDPETLHQELRGKANFWNNSEPYKRAFAAGKMDELIARFEDVAAASPNDPQAQMDLASAYLAYLQLDQTKWQYSMKADGAFDEVLALDENHWEARFTKAVSYTFWPDFLGKKQEAVTHFERLVAQQDSMPAVDYQAQTYLYLGNLLAERDPERAREIWQRGLRRHPGNADLLQKLGQ
ncbi:MAG: hypothetical protein AB7O97_24350 [Planctomycetota bacterium]